jgi:heme exporter protein D
MGNYQARFWRAVGVATLSLTLITTFCLVAKRSRKHKAQASPTRSVSLALAQPARGTASRREERYCLAC